MNSSTEKEAPEVKFPPYASGKLPVSHGHVLNYELYGNPKGKPLVLLHGGPGGGFEDKHKRFFDPKKWNVLLFDQRGSGKSTPYGELKHNTTQDLVEDILALFQHVGFSKATVMGGSWGSTLSLVFAMMHPEKVENLLVWGIFLATQQEMDYIYDIPRFTRPHLWEGLMEKVPAHRKNDFIQYYYEKMNSDDEKERNEYILEWVFYECALLKMKVNERKLRNELAKEIHTIVPLALLEGHYFVNNCFLPKDFILENVHKISHIPMIILHGSFDYVCPPLSAHLLHQKLRENSTLTYVKSGHSSSEKFLERAIIRKLQSV